MKRFFVLFSFFLVLFSLVSYIAAGVMVSSAKVEMTEKEGKDVDSKTNVEKEKILESHHFAVRTLVFSKILSLLTVAKISSPVMSTEINPPDFCTA